MREFIEKIKNKEIREATELAVDNLPSYFWEVAASSTSKYHPKFSLGKGGLIRHVTFAVEIVLELFNIYPFSDLEKDIIISSLLLHDGLKHGLNHSKYTVKNHADIMATWLEEFWKDEFEGKKEIIKGVKRHMGIWSVEETPQTQVEKMIFLADYLSSRKIYDKYYNVEK